MPKIRAAYASSQTTRRNSSITNRTKRDAIVLCFAEDRLSASGIENDPNSVTGSSVNLASKGWNGKKVTISKSIKLEGNDTPYGNVTKITYH